MITPGVFTLPPTVSFVDALAASLLDDATDPLLLTRTRILLPTRRACRALQHAFLRRRGGRPLLLPRLTPLGDVDEDDLLLTDESAAGHVDDLSIPPAIPPLRRQLLLTQLVTRLGGIVRDQEPLPEQAARLARELARLLDQVQTERLDLADLAKLVPDEFAAHWQVTLRFLQVITEHWPRVLNEQGCIDPADRRNRLLAALAQQWTQAPPATPVIAAGSTGSIPATADLIRVIASLPRGAVILPGLDTEADDATWRAIADEPWHPQYGLAQLLARLGIDRDAVRRWPHPPLPQTDASRSELIQRALRPASVSDAARAAPVSWRAVVGVQRVELPRVEEEARTIALVMRQTLVHPGKTAALVTPDRVLARRVAAELERWGITVDDSAGQLLGDTPPGAFLRLVAQMVASAFAPVPLLAALKHPLAAAGLSPARFRDGVRRLERAALRQPRPAPGLAGLSGALAAGAPGAAHAVVRRLTHAVEPFAQLFEGASASLRMLLQQHVAAAEALATSDTATGASRLWQGDAGEALANFVAELAEAAGGFEFVGAAGYPALFETLLAGRVVRPRYGRHPRLAIWGPLEARLQRADVIILGSLNEETWPPRAAPSPWMSRPMMQAFGLPLPERRIGLSAHDFCQAFAAPEVWLTRARRKEGTPTVPCRWLLRIEALLRGTGAGTVWAEGGGGAIIYWQSRLDEPHASERISIVPPAPRPPVAARPRELSVTRIETWMRDPYAIYAGSILKLKALQPLDAHPGAADYGSLVHRTLDHFVQIYPQALPEDPLAALLACGREVFAPMLNSPSVRAFWWPRFARIAEWFIEQERERRPLLARSWSEVSGELTIPDAFANFRLTAKADRIDLTRDGRLIVIDYKTGALPSRDEIIAGFAPQLPLEAAIAIAGGFADIGDRALQEVAFWRLRGTAAGGECRGIGEDAPALAGQALAGLRQLIAVFDEEAVPYEARPRASAAPRFSDYEHLARVREWSEAAAEAE
jgi:ATP-dependent helicase/nuclease subunit B